jgi:hypothetical protein
VPSKRRNETQLSVYLSQNNVQQVTKYINLAKKRQSISVFFPKTGIWLSNFTWPTAINYFRKPHAYNMRWRRTEIREISTD